LADIIDHDLAHHALGVVVPHEAILDNIGDVSVPFPVANDLIYWDAVNNQWMCRALLAGDIPNLDTSKITSGVFDAARLAGRVGEGHITIIGYSYSSIGQGTWGLLGSPNYIFYQNLYNSTQANGDNILYNVYLDTGTYTLLLVTHTMTNGGIVDFDVDATEVASFDLYSNPAVYNVRKTQANINIATSGLKTLKLRLHGKNPAATAHCILFSYIALWRTA